MALATQSWFEPGAETTGDDTSAQPGAKQGAGSPLSHLGAGPKDRSWWRSSSPTPWFSQQGTWLCRLLFYEGDDHQMMDGP